MYLLFDKCRSSTSSCRLLSC